MKAVSFGTVEEAQAAFAMGRPTFLCAVCGKTHRPHPRSGRYGTDRCVEKMFSRMCAAPVSPGLPRVFSVSRRLADWWVNPFLPLWLGREKAQAVRDALWEAYQIIGEAAQKMRDRAFELPGEAEALLALEKPIFRQVTSGWRDRFVEPAVRRRFVELVSSASRLIPPVPGPAGAFYRDGSVALPDGRPEPHPFYAPEAHDAFGLGRAPWTGAYGRASKQVHWAWRGERVLVTLAGDSLVFSWGVAGLAVMLFLEPEEVAAIAGAPSDARFWEGLLP